VGNVSTNVYAKFRCALLRIKKGLGIFREQITRGRRTTRRVAFWDPPSGSKKHTKMQKIPGTIPKPADLRTPVQSAHMCGS